MNKCSRMECYVEKAIFGAEKFSSDISAEKKRSIFCFK